MVENITALTDESREFAATAATFDASELALCDAIEDAADRLPNVCIGRYLRIAAALRAVYGAQRRRPTLPPDGAATAAEMELLSLLERLETEAASDADVALELADALEAAAHRGAAVNPDALGYLKRCYFENRRRHIAWRRELLITPARAQLSPAAFRALAERLAPDAPELDLLARRSTGR